MSALEALRLDAESQRWLCASARAALREAMGLEYEALADPPEDPQLSRPHALFVSWHLEGRLVGCIGTLEARYPLYAGVRHFAVQAGLHDHRTPPLREAQVDALELEITLLSPLFALGERAPEAPPPTDPVTIAALLRPGVDGLELRDGQGRRAFFLPSVWAQLPEAEAFVAALMRKAGMPGDPGPLAAQVCEGVAFGDPHV